MQSREQGPLMQAMPHAIDTDVYIGEDVLLSNPAPDIRQPCDQITPGGEKQEAKHIRS